MLLIRTTKKICTERHLDSSILFFKMLLKNLPASALLSAGSSFSSKSFATHVHQLFISILSLPVPTTEEVALLDSSLIFLRFTSGRILELSTVVHRMSSWHRLAAWPCWVCRRSDCPPPRSQHPGTSS